MQLYTSIYNSMVAKIIIDDVTGCWMYQGTDNGQGYKLIYANGKMQAAHRVMYCCVVGPIPAGKEINHLCRKRGCVNPAHLEAVTHPENMAYTEAYDHLRWERFHLLLAAYPALELFGTVCVASTILAKLWNCLSNNIPPYLRTSTLAWKGRFQWACVQQGRGPKPSIFRLWFDPALIEELRIVTDAVSSMV
jgi:hypothetical protein